MQKILLGLQITAAALFAGEFFIESSNPAPRELLPGESSTQEGVAFSSQAGYALITIAGNLTMESHEGLTPSSQTTTTWLEIDSDSIGVTTYSVAGHYYEDDGGVQWQGYEGSMSFAYVLHLQQGGHLIELKVAASADHPGTCSNTYLQVLVYQEEQGALGEHPPDPELPHTSDVLTAGPCVYAPGAYAVFDAAGREAECELEGDYLDISNLSPGTYTIRTETGVTKLIKIR